MAYGQQKPLDEEQSRYLRRTQQGANWFFWIAIISLINIIFFLTGETLSFVIGLGVTSMSVLLTQYYDSASITILVALITFILLAVFALCGFYARKGNMKAFTAGVALYSADAVLLALIGDWMGIGFHVLVLIFILMGMDAARKYNSLKNPFNTPGSDIQY